MCGVLCSPLRRALAKPQGDEAIAKHRRHVLTAAVAVKDEAARRPPAPHGGVEHHPRQARIAPPTERPGEHSPRVLVHDHSEKAPATPHRHVSEVAYPDVIRTSGAASGRPIRMLTTEPVQTRVRAIDPCPRRPQTRVPHEPLHSTSTRPPALATGLAADSRTSVAAMVSGEERHDPPSEPPVLFGVRTRRAPPPRVVARAAHPVEGRQTLQRERPSLALDAREDRSARAEQNRMAFVRSACSSCRSACACSSSWSRRISLADGTFTPELRPLAAPPPAPPSATARA